MSHMSSFRGMSVIEDIFMTETKEDWSQVRSPARARRRRNKHPQRIRYIQVPRRDFFVNGGLIICHPVMAAELRRRIKEA